MDRIDEMRSFIAVVEAGSFVSAADRLGVATSMVSRRVKDLEERLGAQLLQRTTRRMNVTDAGQRFHARAKQILDELAEAENEAAEQQQALTGTLRVAAPVTFGIHHLSPALTEFLSAHPDLSLDLDMSDRKVDLLQDGVDVAVRIGSLEDSSLMARKLCDVKQVIAATPAFWDEHGRPEHPNDLEALPTFAYSNSTRPREWPWRDKAGREGKIEINPRITTNNGDVSAAMAIAGLGVLCVPCFIIYQSIESGELEPVLADYSFYGMGLHAVWPPQSFMPARTRAFIDFLVGRFGGEPYWQQCLSRN